MANLATEIIGEMKSRMVKTNNVMDEAMGSLAKIKAVVNAIGYMAEGECGIIVDALGGVVDMLETLDDKIEKRFDSDYEFLSNIENGTDSD